MEFLKEVNLSKYKINIDCYFKYCFVKTNNIYDNNLIDDNIIIKSYYKYDEHVINNIKKYCNQSHYDFIIKNEKKQYYQNLNKTTTEYLNLTYNNIYQCYNDINYLKEINIIDKNDNNYIGYFNISSYIKPVNFPSLINYNYEVNYNNILCYKKEYKHFDIINTTQKTTSINLEINKNKCILSLLIGNNNLNNETINLINNEILNLTAEDKLNIKLDDNYLKLILNNKILNS